MVSIDNHLRVLDLNLVSELVDIHVAINFNVSTIHLQNTTVDDVAKCDEGRTTRSINVHVPDMRKIKG